MLGTLCGMAVWKSREPPGVSIQGVLRRLFVSEVCGYAFDAESGSWVPPKITSFPRRIQRVWLGEAWGMERQLPAMVLNGPEYKSFCGCGFPLLWLDIGILVNLFRMCFVSVCMLPALVSFGCFA